MPDTSSIKIVRKVTPEGAEAVRKQKAQIVLASNQAIADLEADIAAKGQQLAALQADNRIKTDDLNAAIDAEVAALSATKVVTPTTPVVPGK